MTPVSGNRTATVAGSRPPSWRRGRWKHSRATSRSRKRSEDPIDFESAYRSKEDQIVASLPQIDGHTPNAPTPERSLRSGSDTLPTSATLVVRSARCGLSTADLHAINIRIVTTERKKQNADSRTPIGFMVRPWCSAGLPGDVQLRQDSTGTASMAGGHGPQHLPAGVLQKSHKHPRRQRCRYRRRDVDCLSEQPHAEDKARLRIYPGGYQWDDFRDQVQLALTNYYGARAVSEGNKCLKVAGSGNRLNADVVPCITYRNYDTTLTSHAAGITFRTRSGIWIINYPTLHYDHGVLKNAACQQNYRPNIRVFKNARNRAGNDFPSYFLECLLSNIRTDSFTNSHADTFERALNYLLRAQNTESLAAFVCQNGQQSMFGTALHQTSLESAHVLIGSLVTLWNNWP